MIRNLGSLLSLLSLISLISLVTALGAAQAESYPTGPINLVIPLAAGDATDTAARAITEELSRELKVAIVPVNRPGGHPGHVQVDVALAAGLEHRRVALAVFFEGRDEAVEITRRAARELERPGDVLAEDLLWLDVGAPRPEIELELGQPSELLLARHSLQDEHVLAQRRPRLQQPCHASHGAPPLP